MTDMRTAAERAAPTRNARRSCFGRWSRTGRSRQASTLIALGPSLTLSCASEPMPSRVYGPPWWTSWGRATKPRLPPSPVADHFALGTPLRTAWRSSPGSARNGSTTRRASRGRRFGTRVAGAARARYRFRGLHSPARDQVRSSLSSVCLLWGRGSCAFPCRVGASHCSTRMTTRRVPQKAELIAQCHRPRHTAEV